MKSPCRGIAAFVPCSLRHPLRAPRFLSPRCEGGVRGGGLGATNFAAFKGLFWGYIPAPLCPLRANHKPVYDVHGMRPTPPGPPFTRGGKVGHPPRQLSGEGGEGNEWHPLRQLSGEGGEGNEHSFRKDHISERRRRARV
jgi:hypothetical protein